MKPLILLSTIVALLASLAIAPAKEREDEEEHKAREHRREVEKKQREVEKKKREKEDDDDDDHKDDGGRKQGEGKQREGKKGKAANLPPASTQQGITFAKDISPLFEDACVRCHGEDKQKGKLRVDTLAELMKGSEDGAIVVPGQSAKSKLLLSVARIESAMPPDRKPGKDVGADGKKLPPVAHFTPEQVGLVRAWIDQGAK